MMWAEVITAGCAVVTTGTIVWGISAWRREYVGKRKIELAETVLALFYEAEDIIKWIRSLYARAGEGSTRKRGANESRQESEILDGAYVAIERYQTKEKVFAELGALKYRMMAKFGIKSGEPFDEINQAVNQILFAAQKLGTYYWPNRDNKFRTEQQSDRFDKQLDKFEKMLWIPREEDDEIGPQVRRAVEKIEAITQEAVKPVPGLADKLWRRFI